MTHAERGNQLNAMFAGLAALALALPAAVRAQTTVHYDFLTQGEVSGQMELTRDASGERSTHFEFNDRGRGPSLDERYRVNESGLIEQFEVSGNAYMGAPVAERFDYDDGVARWSSKLESGTAQASLESFYLANDSTPEQTAALARALLAAGDDGLPIWPTGHARIARVAETTVTSDGESRNVSLHAISGLNFDRSYVWLDAEHELFAISGGWMGLAPRGWSDQLQQLAEIQQSAEREHLQGLAAELTQTLPGEFCLRDFSVLDVDAGRLQPHSSVRIEGGRIATVGANAEVGCSGLTVIEGNNQTLMPGLWDMHVHVSLDDGPLHIAAGVTSVRDLANDHDQVMDAIGQWTSGEVIGPDVYRAGIIDGAGPFAAPTGNLADSLDEALEIIGQIDEQGYPHIKIYSSIKPEWVAPMTAEARRRDIRVSGHVPSGMTAAEAVEAGFDEIQHINMVFLNFLAGPDDDTRTPVRFTLVAEHGADLDLGAEPVQAFITLLQEHGTVVDPTVAIFDNMFRHRSGDISPSYAAVADHLPPNVRRGMLAGEMDIDDANAEHYAASARALLDMIRALHEAGVPLVAGTDALPGFTLHRELELYAEAGIPAAEVLRIATIGAAQVVGQDERVGRIAPGYTADLIAVDGNPLEDIGALRNTTMTLKGTRMYQPAALHRAMGIEPFGEPLQLP